jgi:hypothetical protein
MAWMALAPLAFSAVKSAIDSGNAQSGDAAMQQAGREKLAAMRQGAQQVEQYRQTLMPQQLQAMQNQMAMYGGAQNVLSQMYGGHPGALTGTRLPPTTTMQQPGMYRPSGLLGQMSPPGPAINPGTPGGARAGNNPNDWRPPVAGGARAGNNPNAYLSAAEVPRMGFGGEMPMPSDLLRRKV